jgi:hypothetical protein
LTLGALALHTTPATADDGDGATIALTEARVAKPATVRAEPPASAAGVTSLGVDDAVYVITRITDKDGVTWYQIAMLDAAPIGWLPADEVLLVIADEND